jgi:recombination protein RecA
METQKQDRAKAVNVAVDQIEKQFGKGAIMRLGEGAPAPEVAVISTGSLGLDIALGTGGLPRGRIVEVYGPESSGKTTLALHAIAEAQRGAIPPRFQRGDQLMNDEPFSDDQRIDA